MKTSVKRSGLRHFIPLEIPIQLTIKLPISNAEEVRRGFRTNSHLLIDGDVHSDPLFLSSPKIKEVMLEFMNGQPVSTTHIALPPLKFVALRR